MTLDGAHLCAVVNKVNKGLPSIEGREALPLQPLIVDPTSLASQKSKGNYSTDSNGPSLMTFETCSIINLFFVLGSKVIREG